MFAFRLISLAFIFVVIAPQVHADEVTNGNAFGEYDDSVKGTDGKRTCTMRVRNTNYNIRSDGSIRAQKCGSQTLNAGNINSLVALGSFSQGGKIWIKFAEKSCPNGVGYVHENALNAEDVQSYQLGTCGLAIRYGYRNPPASPVPVPTPPAQSAADVQPLGKTSHRFPLDRCLGIKNKGGNGSYGSHRNGGRTHAGCDYYSPKGTTLRSPCNGKVTASGPAGSAGNLLQINCDNGDYFRMMHLNSTPRRAALGTRVSSGTPVGGVGNTGNARNQAPHLHLEAYIHGRRQNPQKLWSCGGDSGH
jgi:hypothetical protein